MFENLTDKFTNVFSRLRGRGKLTESDLKEAFRDVRLALLEADVNYKVVKDFIYTVTSKALGHEILKTLTPGQQVVKIVYDELTEMMGGAFEGLALEGSPPRAIMLVGLQGSGKTTTAAKLALYLKKAGHSPYLVPADVARPAAILQLTKLSEEIEVPAYPSTTEMAPVDICRAAMDSVGQAGGDVLVIDTAGRLSIDEPLMEELKAIKLATKSCEVLLVADAMTGQEAVNIAADFNRRLDLTGVILSKMEGDARGGAAMSIRAITGKPLKFLGVGERVEALEPFHPDRLASMILGMGDVLSLIEKAQEAYDDEEAKRLSGRLARGDFTFDDFQVQMRNLRKVGTIQSILEMIPGLGKLKRLREASPDDRELIKITAIIDSMTFEERRNLVPLDPSRRRRVAKGSGTSVAEVNQLLKNFTESTKIMKQMFKAGGLDNLRRWFM
jgi:signal recognition particle subunit SRP54